MRTLAGRQCGRPVGVPFVAILCYPHAPFFSTNASQKCNLLVPGHERGFLPVRLPRHTRTQDRQDTFKDLKCFRQLLGPCGPRSRTRDSGPQDIRKEGKRMHHGHAHQQMALHSTCITFITHTHTKTHTMTDMCTSKHVKPCMHHMHGNHEPELQKNTACIKGSKACLKGRGKGQQRQ
jgi:hypothetical protein